MADLALTILGKISEYLVAPIGRQLGYIVYFNGNFETLKSEAEKLGKKKSDIQCEVDAAKRNVETISYAVEAWLVQVSKAEGEARRMIEEKAQFPKGCLNVWCINLKSRYVLSRRAKKRIQRIVEVQQEGKFEKVSFPAPPIVPVMESTSTSRFETRNLILDEIIKMLKDEKINMIGICGMGGVGKTTMADEVLTKATEEKLFDDYAMTVISQNMDLAKAQRYIAEMLGLKLEEQNPITRKAKLQRRLENSKVLIILDDVWEEFYLKDLGITFQGLQKGCKVLFTSRVQGLWKELETKIDILLPCLIEHEAWDLFEAKIRRSLKDKPELQQVAKEIVKECGGLPLSLATIGGALIGKSIHVWNDTLRQLRTDYPAKIRGVSAKVYKSLELSYNYLEKDAKSLFLLCCLFEEDFDIPIEELVKIALGLQLLEGINGLQQAIDRVFAMIENLKNCSLLLSSTKKTSGKEFIKMHDVVRDVAKSIASTEKGALIVDSGDQLGIEQGYEQEVLKDITWISIISKEVSKIPIELRSTRVKLLRCNSIVLQTTDSFFEGMGELQVLDIHGIKSEQTWLGLLGSLLTSGFYPPHFSSSLLFPNSLRTLYIRKCNLDNISFIGDLTNLESLSFVESRIKELPTTVGKLANLVSLDLTKCSGLKTVQPGAISGLCKLQELYMEGIEIDWEGGEKEEGINASLKEFEALSYLHTLHIKIYDPSMLPKHSIFNNLKKYKIEIGRGSSFPSSVAYERGCSICLNKFVPLKGDIELISDNAEVLLLWGEFTEDLVHELVRDRSRRLNYLELSNIDTLEYLTNTTATLLFPLVVVLALKALNLQKISSNPLMVGSFEKLKELEVFFCRKLKNIFSLSIVRKLVHLEKLSISMCEIMEEVIYIEREEDTSNKLVFPKLEELTFSFLQKLVSFCRGVNEIEFVQLKVLSLTSLTQLGSPFSGFFPPKVTFSSPWSLRLGYMHSMKNIWSDQLHLGSFCNLAKLRLDACHELRSVFTSSMTRHLVQLHSIVITNCSALEVVFFKEEEGHEMKNVIILPVLKRVELDCLPKLESFCHMAQDLELPIIDYLRVVNCPEMKTFSPGCVSTPKLNFVRLGLFEDEDEETLEVDNLNSVIAKLYKQEQEKEQRRREQAGSSEEDNNVARHLQTILEVTKRVSNYLS